MERSGSEALMGSIVRRVAVALFITLAAVFLWFRRIDTPAVPVLGRVAHVPILKGEASVPGKLGSEGRATGVEVSVRPGWKSVPLPFDEATIAASLIRPGSRVDILSIPHAAPGEARRATVVMQDVRVLAVGEVRHRRGQPVRASALSVEVATDADAYRLMKAAANGSLRYLLRGSDDSNVGRVELTTTRVVTEVNAATCSNRRGSSLVYDAVRLSCAPRSQVFLVDSAAALPRPP